MPEYRHARGKRYSLRTVLVLAVAARLAGYRGVTAFAQFAGLLSQPQRQAVDCFFSPSRQCYTTPSITTFHNILATLPPETLESAVGEWARQQSERSGQVPPNEADTDSRKAAGRGRESGSRPQGGPAVCMDGKDVRGASRQTADGRRMLVAAVEQGSGLVLGQLEIASKTNEIPALRELAGGLDLTGRTVTADALHAQHKTAHCLLDSCGADYVITAIKDNQPTMLADLRGMDFSACPTCETLDKEHGRIDLRRYWIKPSRLYWRSVSKHSSNSRATPRKLAPPCSSSAARASTAGSSIPCRRRGWRGRPKLGPPPPPAASAAARASPCAR